MSHLSNYFSIKPEEKLDKRTKFFTGLSAGKDILECEAKVKKLTRALTDAQTEYTIKRSMGYSPEYIPCTINPVLKYSNGRSNGKIIFDAITGTPLSDIPDGATVYNLDYKAGSITVLTGYAYDLGAAVTRRIDYTIPSSNNKINIKIDYEELTPLLGDATIYRFNPMRGDITEFDAKNDLEKNRSYFNFNWFPSEIKATEFLNNMYDISRNFENLSLNDVAYYSYNNKAFETIIKTAPENCLSLLLGFKYQKNTSIPKLLELQDEYYDILVKEDLVQDFINLKLRIQDRKDYFERGGFNKTWPEYVQYLVDCKRYAENINFYNVKTRYNSKLWSELLDAYLGLDYTYGNSAIIRKYYKFGKFCNYVVTESINQGYTRLDNFINTLADYLIVCEKYGTNPTLFSSDLNKIHNIVVRNHQIKFSDEQVNEFATKYVGFKDIDIDDKYVITNPKVPQDMQKEGDELNSCLCFYVHKVLKDECLIFFLRLKEKLTNSLVTVEVRDNAIVQAAGMLNRDVTKEEYAALEKFAKDSKLEMRI